MSTVFFKVSCVPLESQIDTVLCGDVVDHFILFYFIF